MPDQLLPPADDLAAPGAPPGFRPARPIPFREQIAQTLDRVPIRGRQMAAGRRAAGPRRPCRPYVSVVEGYVADGRGLLLDARLPAWNRAARRGRSGADRDGDPGSRYAVRR